MYILWFSAYQILSQFDTITYWFLSSFLLSWVWLSTLLFSAVAPDSASKAAEADLREKAKKELEDWHVHQSEQMEKNKANNRSGSDMAPIRMHRCHHHDVML